MFFTSSCSTFLESGNDLDCKLDKAKRLHLLAALRVSGHPQPGSAAHCPCPMLPDRHHHVLLLQKAPNCRRTPPNRVGSSTPESARCSATWAGVLPWSLEVPLRPLAPYSICGHMVHPSLYGDTDYRSCFAGLSSWTS